MIALLFCATTACAGERAQPTQSGAAPELPARTSPNAPIGPSATADAAPPAKTKPAPPGPAHADRVEQPSHSGPTSDKSVELTVVPRFALANPGGGRLDLMYRMTALEDSQRKAPPLDVALVLDRSGSMSGDKLAAVKTAALDALGRLNSRDMVTLVSYDDEVVVHERRRRVEGGMSNFRRAILPLQPGGSTALGPALFESIDILGAGATQRTASTLAHVILMSDGLANHGEDRTPRIAARAARSFGEGISISTLGVGADYNEELMTHVADRGGGRYAFIDDADAIADAVAQEFIALGRTRATRMRLVLQIPSGMQFISAPGYPSEAGSGGEISLAVGGLGIDDSREIIVRLRHRATTTKQLELPRARLVYTDLDSGKEHTIVTHGQLPTSADPQAIAASENLDVAVRVTENELAAELHAASLAVDRGKFGEAQKRIDAALDRMSKAPPKHREALHESEDALHQAKRELKDARQSRKARKLYSKKNKSAARGKMRGKKVRKSKK